MQSVEVLTSIALGIGLAAAVGLRVFLPLLVLAIAGYAGVVPLSESFQWLATLPAVAMLGVYVFKLVGLTGPAILLGAVFLVLKGSEYADLFAQGIGTETHAFYTFSFLLTGFHAAHVLAGMVLLAVVGWLGTPKAVETGAAFWHMVDLVWVLLFPVVYLL